MSDWIRALKEWNKNKSSWCVPKKGSADYNEVRAIMDRMQPMPKTKKQIKEEKERKTRVEKIKKESKQKEVKRREKGPTKEEIYAGGTRRRGKEQGPTKAEIYEGGTRRPGKKQREVKQREVKPREEKSKENLIKYINYMDKYANYNFVDYQRNLGTGERIRERAEYILKYIPDDNKLQKFIEQNKIKLEYEEQLRYNEIKQMASMARKAKEVTRECKGLTQGNYLNRLTSIGYYLDKDNYKATKDKTFVINDELEKFKGAIIALEKYPQCHKDRDYKEGIEIYKKIYGTDDTIRKLWRGIWKKLKHINTPQIEKIIRGK